MSAFATAINSITQTWNGALSLSSPADPSSQKEKNTGRVKMLYSLLRGSDEETCKEVLSEAFEENAVDTFILLMNLRDCRGGKGERNLARQGLLTLYQLNPLSKTMVYRMISLVPEYGRWDDLVWLYGQTKDFFILQFISEKIDEDLRRISDEDGVGTTLLGKWLPRENSLTDRNTDFVKDFCKFKNISPKKYRCSILKPLAERINVVESMMVRKEWDLIDFSKVPSRAMKNYKKAFEKNAQDHFREWIENLKRGKVDVKARQLFPHEIITEMRHRCWSEVSNATDVVLEEQWKVLEKQTNESVKERCSNAVVVCDVSGSMYDSIENSKSTCVDVSIALALLISNAVSGAFHNHVITFSSNPEFHLVSSKDSLRNRVRNLKNASWGSTTNIQAVFDLILSKAKSASLDPKDMPETVFIVSDMQFDCAIGSRRVWNEPIDPSSIQITNFEEIKRKYNESNYELPKIVFWNVNGSVKDFPVQSTEQGTTMVSGFSTFILERILQTENLTTDDVLDSVLNSPRYQPVREALDLD